MSLIRSSTEISDLKEPAEKFRYIQLFLQGCKNVVNGSIEFGKNIRSNTVEVSFSSVNTNKTINHGLGFVPNGYFVVSKDAAVDVYNGTVASTKDDITLRATVATTVKILFF